MSDQPQPDQPAAPPARTFRIHLLVKDDAGPIHSAPGGTTFKVGTKSRWRAACDAKVELGELERGTTLPWAVRCQACRGTEAFRAAGGHLPKPGQQGAEDLVSEP